MFAVALALLLNVSLSRSEPPPIALGELAASAAEIFADHLDPGPPSQPLEITEETTIILDGKVVELEEIPPTALVIKLVLAKDGKTVVLISFRSSQ